MSLGYYGDKHGWGMGIVEDIDDPLRAGRVRVRIYGLHSEDAQLLPFTDLPWSQVMMPVTSAGISGISTSPTGLRVGSLVYGDFLDGESKQNFLVIGTILGISQPTLIQGATQENPNELIGNSNSEKIFNFFRSRRYTDEQASGILASMTQVVGTSLSPSYINGNRKGIGNFDLVQYQELVDFSSERALSPDDLLAQLLFIDLKLSDTTWPNVIISQDAVQKRLEKASTAQEASDAFTQGFYNLSVSAEVSSRHQYARQAISAYGFSSNSEDIGPYEFRSSSPPGELGSFVSTREHLRGLFVSTTRTIDELIVHHTNTYENMQVDVFDVDSQHRDNGFSRISYHFLILRDGRIQIGAPISDASGLGGKQFKSEKLSSRELQTFTFFVNNGYTESQAAGFVGNIKQESNFDERALNASEQAFGIAQWRNERRSNFLIFSAEVLGRRIDITDSSFEEQLRYIIWELENTETLANNKIRASSTARQAAEAIDRFYERSSGSTIRVRQDTADRVIRSVRGIDTEINHSNRSVNIAFAGGRKGHSSSGEIINSSDTFTDTQWASFDTFLFSWLEAFPNTSILGHSDIQNDRSDPNFDVRAYVAARAPLWTSVNPPAPAQVPATSGVSTSEEDSGPVPEIKVEKLERPDPVIPPQEDPVDSRAPVFSPAPKNKAVLAKPNPKNKPNIPKPFSDPISSIFGGQNDIDLTDAVSGILATLGLAEIIAGSFGGDSNSSSVNEDDIISIINSTPLNAATLNNQSASFYLDYNNLVNVPTNVQPLSSTDDLAEGSVNLYFTQSRVSSQISIDVNSTYVEDLQIDYNSLSNVPASQNLSTTDDLNEGSSNLYFTNSRVMSLITADYIGNLGINYADLSNLPILQNLSTTNDLNEGSSNLYFTPSRVTSIVTKDYVDGLNINSSELNGEAADFYLDYNNLNNTPSGQTLQSTDELAEGSSNLYFTNDRVTGIINTAYVNNLSIDYNTLDNLPASQSDGTTLGGVPAENFVQGTSANRTASVSGGSWNDPLPSGFFNAPDRTDGPGSSWNWLLNFRHDNVTNQFGWQLANPIATNDFYLRGINNGSPFAWGKIWTDQNDGAGSGLDAALLNGVQGSAYMRTTAIEALNMNSRNITNVQQLSAVGASSFDKLRVWNNANHTIGMYNGPTYGALAGDFIMSFTMGGSANRGWLWRNTSDGTAAGAMSLTNGGNLTVKNAITASGSITANSDIRLKKNIEKMSFEEASSLLSKMQFVRYDWKQELFENEKPNRDFGVIAQNEMKHLPQLIDVTSQHGIEDVHSFDYAKSSIIASTVTQGHITKIANLERELSEIKQLLEMT